MLRAEYLAMKVRYETRLENLQKEHMKLLGVLDKLQREKVLNQEMIKGVQKGMGTMKETYTKDLEHWKEERNVLEKHIKEVFFPELFGYLHFKLLSFTPFFINNRTINRQSFLRFNL